MWTNNQVNTSLSGQTGTDEFVGSNTPTITTPQIVTAIEDVNGNNIIGLNATASAVNYVEFLNNISGQAATLAAVGSDTDVYLGIYSKGSGGVAIGSNGLATFIANGAVASQINYISANGSATTNPVSLNANGIDTDITFQINSAGTGGVVTLGSSAGSFVATGYVGEQISNVILSGSAISCAATTVAKDLTSIDVTAGNWAIVGNIYFDISTVTGNASAMSWLSTTSATAPDNSLIVSGFGVGGSNNIGNGAATLFLSVSTTTTVYISGACTYGSGSPTMCGGIYATRLP